MNRRTFLRFGSTAALLPGGVAALGCADDSHDHHVHRGADGAVHVHGASTTDAAPAPAGVHHAAAPMQSDETGALVLRAVAGDVRMTDGTSVHVLTFSANGTPAFPGPTFVCEEGARLTVALENTLGAPVTFVVGGTAIRAAIAAGARERFSFDAPPPGTYLYYDDQHRGVSRVLGLHGAFVVMPRGLRDRSFAGGPVFARQYKWLLASVDPAWGARVRNAHSELGRIDPASFRPRHFTINGASHPGSHDDHDTAPMGRYGEPALVRILNASGMVHAPHFHGNHVEVVAADRLNFAGARKRKDVVPMFPLAVKDVLVPFSPPPDAHPPVAATTAQHFPVHCHVEMSQTTGGGRYPMGMNTALHMGAAPAHAPRL